MATVNIPIRVHSVEAGITPGMQTMQYATGQTFINGAVLIFSTGEVIAASTNPTSGIVGVALQGAGTNPGYDMANSPTTFTGRKQTVTVSRPADTILYAAQLVNGSDTIVAPAIADVGGNYGLRLCAGGFWAVDKNLTTAVHVEAFYDSPYGGIVVFKFQAGALFV